MDAIEGTYDESYVLKPLWSPRGLGTISPIVWCLQPRVIRTSAINGNALYLIPILVTDIINPPEPPVYRIVGIRNHRLEDGLYLRLTIRKELVAILITGLIPFLLTHGIASGRLLDHNELLWHLGIVEPHPGIARGNNPTVLQAL